MELSLRTAFFVWLLTPILGLLSCSHGGSASVSSLASGGADTPTVAELETLLMAEFERLGIDPDKVSAAAPTGEENEVFDLTAVVDDPDGAGPQLPTGVTLSWTERIVGDYDQNSEVNISDVSAIGVQYGQTVDYDPADQHDGIAWWPTGDPDAGGAANWRSARIDGDSNTEINIADLTPIAQHWQNKLMGYRIYRRGPGDTAYTMVENDSSPSLPYTIDRPSFEGGDPVRYEFSEDPPGEGEYVYYVAPYDNEAGEEGAASNHATADFGTIPSTNEKPQAVLIATPSSGDAPLEVSLSATMSSDEDGTIVKYEWDYEDDGTYDFDSGTTAVVSHNYAEADEYKARVRVTDNEGATDTDTADITVNVPVPNDPPEAFLEVDPTSGEVPITISLDASASYDPEGAEVSFQWDWEGDGEYDYTSGSSSMVDHEYTQPGDHNPTVKVVDDKLAFDTASDSISLTGLAPPIADITADVTEGDTPLTVNFDASGSSDSDGTIVKYEWDWEGDGEYDDDTGTTPTNSHTYTSGGIYYATVRVTDDDDQIDTDSIEITVHGWTFIIVDEPGQRGKWCQLLVVDGKPAICYFSFAQPRGMRYIRAEDANGMLWPEPLSAVDLDGGAGDNANGQWSSMAIINGNPAISTFSQDDKTIEYIRALDAQGASWGTHVIIDSAVTSDGGHTALLDVEGRPAIAYYDHNVPGLRFIRANDATGASWPATSIAVDSGNFAGRYTSMLIINGNPAIAYQDISTSDRKLMYVRASSADGSSWGTPQGLDSEDLPSPAGTRFVGGYANMIVVNGNPAITYHISADSNDINQTSYSALCYMRATDASGSSWGSRQILEESGATNGRGRYGVLQIFDGFPTIGFVNIDDVSRLYLIQASDTSGIAWGTKEEIRPDVGNEAGYISMQVVNGNTALCYYDYTDKSSGRGDLVYAIYI